MSTDCNILILYSGFCLVPGQITWWKFFLSLLCILTSSGEWCVSDGRFSSAEDQVVGWGGEPGIYQWDVGGGLDPVLPVSSWEGRRTSSGKVVSSSISVHCSVLLISLFHSVHTSETNVFIMSRTVYKENNVYEPNIRLIVGALIMWMKASVWNNFHISNSNCVLLKLSWPFVSPDRWVWVSYTCTEDVESNRIIRWDHFLYSNSVKSFVCLWLFCTG